MKVYQRPQYYEIAFSFRDLRRKVDSFEVTIRKFSRVKVRSVFGLGAGTCPYLEEWHQRGYRYFGLDAGSEMIEFSRRRARELHANLTLFRGHMVRFALGSHRVDLAYVLLSSLYVRTNGEFFTHLDSVSEVLNRGCLYLLDGVVRFNIVVNARGALDHETGRDQSECGLPAGVGPSDRTACVEHVILDVDDHGKTLTLESTLARKLFFPQEFLLAVQIHRQFGSSAGS
jgi:hypothetical protein